MIHKRVDIFHSVNLHDRISKKWNVNSLELKLSTIKHNVHDVPFSS